MKVIIEVNSCEECPFLKRARTYGNDGKDGIILPYCSKGCFGKFEPNSKFYLEYHKEDISVIHPNCKLNSPKKHNGRRLDF